MSVNNWRIWNKRNKK